jgi:serine/threonine-protein kinase HipA
LEAGEVNYHAKCCKRFFGTALSPEIPFTLDDVNEYAVHTLGKSVSVTGVQPKISLETQRSRKQNYRFTIVGVLGNFILKPPTEDHPEMPENEDLTMHLSGLLKIKTAEHSLIRLKSGELAYITKRFDRTKKDKVPVEDMAQLTGTLTENKYRGSMEKIGQIVKQYSSFPLFDLISLYELTLFAFITGNADMHLKNFSLLTNENNEVMLTPAYDLLSTKLLIPEDTEELALPMNGKKSNLKLSDFNTFAHKLGINAVSAKNVLDKFFKQRADIMTTIENSFLSENVKKSYVKLVEERFERFKNVE